MCGTIVTVGTQVASSRIGERVLVGPCLIEADGKPLTNPWYFGSECDGGFAEYTLTARHAHVINSELSDVELASFPCSYSTAENMLTRAQVSTHDLVLITGASGVWRWLCCCATRTSKRRKSYRCYYRSKSRQNYAIGRNTHLQTRSRSCCRNW